MFLSVINSETKKTIDVLTEQKFIRSFYLAGGTGCAIHIGHRISDDYGEENYNLIHIMKNLVYFKDADEDADLKMLDQYSWQNVKDFFSRQVKSLKNLTF